MPMGLLTFLWPGILLGCSWMQRNGAHGFQITSSKAHKFEKNNNKLRYVRSDCCKRKNRKRPKYYDLAIKSISSLGSGINPNDNEGVALPPTLPSTLLPGARKQHKDVVIIGGGLAGLSTAFYLSQLAPDRKITILDREERTVEARISKTTTVASFAAAGMLAPQSERLPKGDLLDLCLESRRMFPDFCNLVETLAKESGDEGKPYLFHSDGGGNDMEAWSVGYVASGGFLAPAFAGDAVATWAPPEESGRAVWLDSIQVRELEPNLHPDVVGGWWFPEDASVDARRLTCSLVAACIGAGVEFKNGKNYEVTSLDLEDGKCKGLWLSNRLYYKANSILVANGAWMRTLLPVPIEPHKGQSLSIKMPSDRPPILRRVLFAQDSYIVPKADGHIVIGATVEAGSYDGNVTPSGIMHILSNALQLVPGLADLPIKETWAGLRPTTPDKGPILGETPWNNLFLAGGYWRNGVLLAPKTAYLLASLIADLPITSSDATILKAFSWERFTSKEGGAKLAASTRYAASMHPIHSRRSGAGVAAAVGTELGFYSTARSGSDERKRDRDSLWGIDESGNFVDDSSEEAFERAATLGKQDARAYSSGWDKEEKQSIESNENMWFANFNDDAEIEASEESSKNDETDTFEGTADAYTVGSSLPDEEELQTLTMDSANNLPTIYHAIQTRKAKTETVLPEEATDDSRPDPGFRIYHVDSETKKSRMVPPYTTPEDFLKIIEAKKKGKSQQEEQDLGRENDSDWLQNKSDKEENINNVDDGYNEKTYDGYQAIQQANARLTRDEELEAMREARRKNRMGQSSIDVSAIGAQRAETQPQQPQPPREMQQITSSNTVIDSSNNTASSSASVSSNTDVRKVPLESLTSTSSSSDGTDMKSIYQLPKKSEKEENSESVDDESNDKFYDGYQAIQQANARLTRDEELDAMREARRKNRMEQSSIDISAIGAQRAESQPQPQQPQKEMQQITSSNTVMDSSNNTASSSASVSSNTDVRKVPLESLTSTLSSSDGTDMKSIYKSIQDRKAKIDSILPDEKNNKERPDPGFRIYHVDPETRESRMVPPYTSPGEFLEMVEEGKKINKTESDETA